MRTGPPSSSSGPAAPASPLSGECHGQAGDVPKHTRTIMRTASALRAEPGLVPSKGLRRSRRAAEGDFATHRGVPRSCGDGGLGSSPPARSSLWGSALATAVGRQLLGQATVLLPLLQELLAVLRREGPSTEGIFRKAASGTELRELREALDRDADVDLGNQPALLLAAVLKDFLRSIPDKLLVTHLYEDWMAAMERTSKEEKVSELKAVAEKLPAANLFLLKRLLSLLQHIGRNAATSRMSCSNLAICLGPNLLSPPDEELLPLQAMLEVTEKVNTLALFMIENCGDIVGEEVAGRSCPSAGESPAPTDGATGAVFLLLAEPL
ncbi:T-cell activation Rho GTPase-activating protein-like [Buteo buteo]|uniref:T-cell activation Rho GTPase-activating protein-like n=1 Tax=Buteo buteo TaxID=30397 RepID=UPI003EB84C54